jgi:hypothetical protein
MGTAGTNEVPLGIDPVPTGGVELVKGYPPTQDHYDKSNEGQTLAQASI